MKKIYIVQKYVTASSISEALKLEKNIKPEDIRLNDYTKYYPFVENKNQEVGFKK